MLLYIPSTYGKHVLLLHIQCVNYSLEYHTILIEMVVIPEENVSWNKFGLSSVKG